MTVHLAIRGFADQKKVFEDLVEFEELRLDRILPELAEKHGKALAAHELHMIEIEFLDEPDPMQRFFRFGTDPSGMVRPIGLGLLCRRMKG